MSIQQEKFKAIADKIRKKTDSTDKIKPSDFADKIDDVYESGKTKGGDNWYNSFWDAFQHNQTKICNFPRWHRDCFYPKYSMVLTGRQADNFLQFDSYSDYDFGFDLAERLEECDITIDFSQATQTIRCFQNAKFGRLPELDFSSSTNLSNCFANNKYLKTIDKLIISEQAVFELTFNLCPSLEDLRIEGKIAQNGFDVSSCTKLTYESLFGEEVNAEEADTLPIDNVIELNGKYYYGGIIPALKDYSGTSTTRTITLGTTNLAKLGDAEKAIATQRGWSLS